MNFRTDPAAFCRLWPLLRLFHMALWKGGCQDGPRPGRVGWHWDIYLYILYQNRIRREAWTWFLGLVSRDMRKYLGAAWKAGLLFAMSGVLCLYLLAYLRPLGTELSQKSCDFEGLQRVNSHLTSTSLKTTWLWCAVYSGWSLLGASNFVNRSNRWLPFVLVVFVIRGALANAIYPIDRSILMDIRWEGWLGGGRWFKVIYGDCWTDSPRSLPFWLHLLFIMKTVPPKWVKNRWCFFL